MPPTKPSKLRVFVAANVLIAGAASPSENSASLVILRMAELTLIEAVTSRQVLIFAQISKPHNLHPG